MSGGETLVVRQSGQTVSVILQKGEGDSGGDGSSLGAAALGLVDGEGLIAMG